MYMILRWLINALGLLAIGYFVPGISVDSFYPAMILVIAIGLINSVVGMVLKIITWPVNIITLGVSNLVINAILFYVVSTFMQGLEIQTWWAAVIGAVAYTIITIFSNWLYKESYMH